MPTSPPSSSDPLLAQALVPGGDVRVAGSGRGPLAGLVFAAKDIFDVAGTVTGGGNPDWAADREPARRHAAVVAALLDAGADLRGKTITDELTRGILGINAHYGTPPNPGAPGRLPGGSSSGSAAMVAAGAVDFALGSDTGGSVRVPASFCGILGLRPTLGRLSLDGVMVQSPSYDTVGWFARDGATLERVGRVLLGAGNGSAAPTRVLLAEDAFALADEPVAHAVEAALAEVAARVGPVERVRLCPGDLADWHRAMQGTQQFEAQRSFADWVERVNPRMAYDTAARFLAGESTTAQEIEALAPVRAAHRARMLELLGRDTLLALPTAPFPAPPLGPRRSEMWALRQRITLLTCIAGGGGCPQISLPRARVDGLPVGLSLVGPPGSDEALLTLAAMLDG
jgi:amidase